MQWLTNPLSAIRTLPDLNLSSSNYNGIEHPMCLLQFNGLLLFSQIWFYWHPLMLATGFSRLQANCKKKGTVMWGKVLIFQGKRSGFHLLKFHLLELSGIGWVVQKESQLTHLWDRKGFILTLSQCRKSGDYEAEMRSEISKDIANWSSYTLWEVYDHFWVPG